MAKAKIKTLLGTGLAALCSHIKQCNTALGDLSEATANGFEETDDILHEKQDVTAAVSFTIPVDGWGEDDSSPRLFFIVTSPLRACWLPTLWMLRYCRNFTMWRMRWALLRPKASKESCG